MSLQIYGYARNRFALKQLSWTTDAMSASIVNASYVPDVDNQKLLGDLGQIFNTVDIINKTVDDRGWCKSDTIFFPATPNFTFKHIAFWRRSDGLLIVLATLTPFVGGPGKAYTLIKSFATPGLFRV